jgi:hypothetical protein
MLPAPPVPLTNPAGQQPVSPSGTRRAGNATCRGRRLHVHRTGQPRRQRARGGPPLHFPAARRPPSPGTRGTAARAAATEAGPAAATAG